MTRLVHGPDWTYRSALHAGFGACPGAATTGVTCSAVLLQPLQGCAVHSCHSPTLPLEHRTARSCSRATLHMVAPPLLQDAWWRGCYVQHSPGAGATIWCTPHAACGPTQRPMGSTKCWMIGLCWLDLACGLYL